MKFSNLKKLIMANSQGFYCPTCASIIGKTTAKVFLMKDKKFHKEKFYIKCKTCKRTTPAYEQLNSAIEQWDDQFCLYEMKLFED